MDLDDYVSDVIIKRVGHRPLYILNSMVNIQDATPIQLALVPTKPVSSSVGLLEALPTELLHLVFDLLDFRSLSRFARVSHQGKATIESLLSYRDLIKHAFTALVAFNRTALITYHSAASIYKALLSEKCVACEQFAPFLFLPTCERCCYECLHRDRSLRLITRLAANRSFGLTSNELQGMPFGLSILGTYTVGHTIKQYKRTKLFSLKQAKAVAIAYHGSVEAMEDFVTSQNAGKLNPKEMDYIRWLNSHPSTTGSDAKVPTDLLCGMASTEFPALQRNDVLERGVWCKGCQAIFSNYQRTGILDAETRSHVLGTNPLFSLYNLEHRARSKSAFLKHVRVCKGAKDLLRGLEPSVQATMKFL